MKKNKPMTDQAKYEYCQETAKILGKNDEIFVAVGERMCYIKEFKLYQPYWEGWGDYIMDLGEDSTKISRYMRIHKRFTMNGIPAETLKKIKYSKLVFILPMVKTKEEAEVWTELALQHPTNILNQMIAEKKTGLKITDCDHEGSYLLRHCEICKQKWKEYEGLTVEKIKGAIKYVLGNDITDEEAGEILKHL
jgi:hypothetical protein